MNKHWIAIALAGVAAAGAGTQALAQSKSESTASGYYSCRDANGRLLTSDRPIMECLSREQRVHNADGSVRRVIEAPLTPEQKRQREAERVRQQEEKERLEQARRRDQILLSSYSSATSIEQARLRAREEPMSGITKSQTRLQQLNKERDTLAAETEFYKGRAMPSDLERKIKDNQRARQYEEDLLARRNEELRQIDERFEADRKRFVELTEPQPARR